MLNFEDQRGRLVLTELYSIARWKVLVAIFLETRGLMVEGGRETKERMLKYTGSRSPLQLHHVRRDKAFYICCCWWSSMSIPGICDPKESSSLSL